MKPYGGSWAGPIATQRMLERPGGCRGNKAEGRGGKVGPAQGNTAELEWVSRVTSIELV